MELTGLRTFKAVVDEGGIKGASIKLHTVQSNITSRIQRLEAELDTALFERHKRKLELTHSGEALYSYANQMLQLERQAKSAVKLASGSYELQIGSPEPFAAVHLPLALRELRRQTTRIQPKIHTATSAELITDVLENRLDCAFVGGRVNHPDLVAIPVVREEIVRISPADYAEEPVLIIRGEGCAYREYAQRWQRKAGRCSEETMIMSTVDGLLGCVAAGLGYSIISREMVSQNRYETALSLEPLQGEDAEIVIYLIHRHDAIPLSGINTLASLFSEDRNPKEE